MYQTVVMPTTARTLGVQQDSDSHCTRGSIIVQCMIWPRGRQHAPAMSGTRISNVCTCPGVSVKVHTGHAHLSILVDRMNEQESEIAKYVLGSHATNTEPVAHALATAYNQMCTSPSGAVVATTHPATAALTQRTAVCSDDLVAAAQKQSW